MILELMPAPSFDLGKLLGDGGARAGDDGRRCQWPLPRPPDEATPQVCVAAWHAVQHWLQYSDEPVVTCLVGQRAQACWPIVTRADATTPLARLLADVCLQWTASPDDWLDLREPAHRDWLEPVRRHAIRIEAGAKPDDTEFALELADGAWRIDCVASRCSEASQRLLGVLWHHFIVALLERPQALLSAQTCPDAAAVDATGQSGKVVAIEGNVVQRFAAWVAQHPAAPAVIDEDGSLSYADVDALSSQWAQALRAAGAGRGCYVGVALERGRGMVVAQLAVLKTGAAFVPMDAAQPELRLKAVAEDTDMRFVMGTAATVESLRAVLPSMQYLATDHLATDHLSTAPVAEPGGCDVAGVNDPAYVIFTSGSTGRPKGVKVSHGNLLNAVAHFSEWCGPGDVVSQFAPVTFDASIGEIHGALLNGAASAILPAALIDEPDRLQAFMSEHRVSLAAFPPQYAVHLSPDKLPHLKTLLTAGSAPDHALIARWQPHGCYINAYGPTETTILSTAWKASRVPGTHEPIVMGTPVCNTEVRVVNRFNQSLPRGVIGELLIGGEGVTHGYLKRDELTRERFIALDGKRWYRSGDLSCFSADGQLIFAGRIDKQIKVRGHRLEPGEVEVALQALAGVVQAAVAVVDVGDAQQLVAFCVGERQSEDVLRERLRLLLPAWALPNRIVMLDRLPLTPNGKTDYPALVAGLARPSEPAEAVDHGDALQAQVAGIWSGVLQQPRVLPDDSFIHLGGDSLTSLVVTSAVRRLGYEITSAELIRHPRLADYVQRLRAGGQSVEREYACVEGSVPLAPIQAWFFSQSLPHPGRFCQSLVFDSDEAIDAGRLARALAQLTVHHDMLRARFTADAHAPAGWRQDILPPSMPLPALREMAQADDRLDEATEACLRELAGELSLDAAPLFRMAVIRTPQRSRVVWVLHHLIVDTVSHGILLGDLHQLYRSTEADLSQVLPGKSLPYGDWAARLQAQVAGHSPALLAQWRPLLDALAQTPALPLQPAGDDHTLRVSRHLLSPDDTGRLLRCAAVGYRQSAEELVLAATCLALARTMAVDRLAIDIEWHGRDEALAGRRGIDRTVGWFTSVHPLAVGVPRDLELGDWLMALKEARAAIAHRGRDHYSLRYLGDDAEVRAEFARCPKPEVLFNFSGVVQRSDEAWRSVPVAAIEMGEGNHGPYRLSVESEMRDGQLLVGLYHAPAGWAPGRVESMGEAILHNLRDILAHVASRPARWTPSDFPGLALSQAQADALPPDLQSACALTDMQQTLLRHQAVYQVHMGYRMPRAWNEPVWRQAVADWMARHDCLRTAIREWEQGDACQLVLRQVQPPLTVHAAAPGTGEQRLQALLQAARQAPVRLDRAPLFALDVIDDGAADGFLVLLSIHHIIHDGWSIELLLGDLLQGYRHRLGEAVQPPQAPLAGIADIVAAQRRLRASAEWCAHFAGLPWAPLACQLPRRLARNSNQPGTKPGATPAVRLHTATLADDLVDSVRAAARQRGVTVNSLWLAGYVGLLRYLGGQRQVRCGVIQNGRMEEIAGVETITGCCVNTLPLVLNVPPDASFNDIVATVGHQLERMRAAAAFPLSVIHEAVRPVLEDEIFDSLFNIESHRYGTAQALRPTLVGGHESTNHGLVFGLIERESAAADGSVQTAYDVRIGFDTDRYAAADIERWLAIYARCMEALVVQGDQPWHQLVLLPEALRHTVVHEWNNTRIPYPADRCVHELFREQAARHPQRPALLYRDGAISYAELDERTESLARVLCSHGVGPDTVVGLVAERSPDMVVAMLAIYKAGGAFVPIDPRYPADRVRHMVQDVGCKLALVQHRGLASTLPADLAVTALFLDEPMPAARPSAPVQAHRSRQLAYVMYTSGSTGQPKGVMIEHRSIVRLVANAQDIRFDADDRILLTSAPGFDVTTWEVWSALLNGLPLVIVDEETLLDPAALAAEIRRQRVTALWLIAPLFNQLVQEQPDLFAGVRMLMIGGDALSAPHVQLARRANPALRVVNGYGPTENTSFSTYHDVSDADTEGVPIGRPITNSTAYVVNADGQLLPPGASGELYVGGPGVARGYLHQPELTAAKFVPDPYSDEPGACLYRTGDLVRWRDDGLIDFLGRMDHQVKIRGFRIELGEIEAAIAAHPDIKQVLVLVKHNDTQKQLVAYLVPKQAVERMALIDSVVQRLRAGLPDYMVPACYLVLDAMPRNANGKIDRARLPQPDASSYIHGLQEPPANDAERMLWAVWKEVLGTDNFGVTDGFFAVGGDSIMAIQVVAKAGRQGLALTPRLIVEEQTIRRLVNRVARPPEAAATPVTPAAAARPAHRAVQGQQRLLPIQLQYLQDDGVDVDGYCQFALIPLPPAASPAALRLALAALLARHDVLRLKFRETASGWVASYRSDLLTATPDLLDACLDTARPDQGFDAARVTEAMAALDIRQGRLFGWQLVTHGGSVHLLWVMHHLVVDMVSWGLLVGDLAHALEQAAGGQAVAWGDKPGSYQDWAGHLHDWAYDPSLESERGFWVDQLATPCARLPLDGQAAQRPLEASTAVVEVRLGTEDTRQLLQQANAPHGVRIHQLLVAAIARALAGWLAADAVRMDLEGHGREPLHEVSLFDGFDPSLTVGWFTTVYPVCLTGLRTDLRTQIQHTRAQLEAVPRNGLGFGVLRRLAEDEAILAADQSPRDVLFNYLGQADAATVGGSQVSPRRRRTHALRFEGLVQAGQLVVRLDYSRDQFDPDTMTRLLADCAQALRQASAPAALPGLPDLPGGRQAFALSGLAPDEIAALRSRHPDCQDLYPCTGMQQALLLSSDRTRYSGAYLTQLRIELEGADTGRLRDSWQRLMARHEVLRAAFVDAGQASLLQVICDPVALPWREVDGRQLPDAGAFERLLTDERTRPFDAAQAPLMRLLLVHRSDTSQCLAWTHHHALLDGWSIGLLVKELFETYAGAAAPAAPQPAWRDHVEWLQSRDRPAAERYWRDHLDGVEPAAGASASLGMQRRDGAVPAQPDDQAQQTLQLSAAASAQLVRLARAESVGLGSVMLAAWGLLLSKYSAEPEVLFGYASSGRSPEFAGSESLVGLCIRSLPLRLAIDGDAVLGDWLRQIQRRQLDHDDHGHLALGDIQRCSGAHPGQSLFDSLVVVENYPLDRSLLSAAAGVPRILSIDGVEQNDFALNLAVYPGERITLKLAHRTALFDADDVATLLRRLAQLLAAFSAGGTQRLAQLSLLTAAEHERAVRTWNDTRVPDAAHGTVPGLFEAMASSRPLATAIVSGSQRWTYGELDQRARTLSAWLGQNGVKAGSRVALSLRKEPMLVAAMLAVQRLGAAYVPLALDAPPERRAFVLQDAGICCTLTRRGDGAALADARLLFLEDCPASATVADEPLADVDPQATAYVIYTSGTTGTPKGVAISHRNIVNFCAWCRESAIVSAGARVTQFAPSSFDASAGEIFASLLAGSELHLLSDALIQDPRAVAHYLRSHAIDMAAFPPSYLQQMDPDEVPEGLTLLTAGSAPTPELVRQWGARCRYINGYGPTETTILSSAWMCERGAADERQLSIGQPIANTSVYVIDRLGLLCAPGLTGEICIGGDGVAQGYLNQPELTARQFVADPFVPGGRLYRTGDLGRWLDDGRIAFVGRRDRQVKLRGYRIELNEIEHRLRAHPQVRDAAVLVRGVGAEQRLLAWLVAAQPQADAEAQDALLASIRAFMRQTLPDYALPQALVPMAQLPLTTNGKLDERALPEPADLTPDAEHRVPLQTDTQRRVAALWAAVLQRPVDQVGASSDFFALGGHSLLAMRAVARVRQELGADVDVAQLFAQPVLADFAAVVDQAAGHRVPAITPVARDGHLPLSFAQQRLWFLTRFDGVSRAYHMPGALRLTGLLDRAALHAALDRIVARHEGLRTRFVDVAGTVGQRIDPPTVGFALHEHDLGALDAASQPAALAALSEAEAHEPFDLGQGPLMRGRLVRLAPDRHVLLVTQHHIVSDGWSMGVLMRELSALYAAFSQGQGDPLPALSIQYADYAAWQRAWLQGEQLDSHSRYWQHALEGAPALLELPTDRPRPAQQDHVGAALPIAFDETLTQALKALSRRHGVTLFMTLLAGWAAVLARLSGQRDIVIGSPVANRTQVEVEPLIGLFVNTLALRIDLSGQPTVGQLLQRVSQQVQAAQQHQQLPFEQVVEAVQPARSLAHTPVFQVMFNWQNLALGTLELPGLVVAPLATPSTSAKFDLTIDLAESEAGIAGGIEFATALFDDATVERHVGYLRRMLQAMAADEQQRVDRIDVLGDEERFLLQAFNATSQPDLLAHSWPRLFDAQASRTPDRVAVRCATQQLTYRELQDRSSRLAAALRAQGAGAGQIVALLDERGTDLLVMIVATLKSGAAYLPLDPAHPAPRQLDILHEAQPLLLWVGAGLQARREALQTQWQGKRLRSTAELLDTAADAAAEMPYPALHDLAYVIFTSGSTGKPKGVMIEHAGMVNNMRSKFEPLALTQHDVIAQTASQCFDISVWQFLTAGLLGARVVILPGYLAHDPEAWLNRLDAEGVTIWEPVPSVMQAVLPYRQPLPRMRWVLPTGEALSRDLVARWFEQYPAVALMNAYGPAECSDDVSLQPIHAPVERVLIGKPVANAQLHVVDEHLQPLPMGAVGEIAVTGAVVGRGYLNRPQETAAAFRTDPFAPEGTQRRLYLSGDLARRWPDGSLEYIGRKDFQVKIRGFRIELGEIESCLAQHPAVREAVVVARQDGAGDLRLVGYAALAEPAAAAVSPEALRAHLQALLPDYMVPATFVCLDALPLTPNGKIDRKALPAPQAPTRQAEEPVGEMETALAQIWAGLLGQDPIGRHDHFFERGGHSLLAMRVVSQVRERLGLDIAVAEVFARPVLADLAAALQQASSSALPPIVAVGRDAALPLSFAQQRLWFLAQMDEGAEAYHVPGVMRLTGRLDQPALLRTLDDIVARHEVLRTTFVQVGGEPLQRVAPPGARFALQQHDLRDEPNAAGQLDALMREEAGAAFDLEAGPLVRGRLIALGDRDHVLLVTLHHIVTDGWSMGVLIQELGRLYRAHCAGQPSPLPALPIQYADYAVWQRQWLAGDVLRQQMAYWQPTLAGIPALLELPTDRPRPAQQVHEGDVVELQFDEALTAGLKALSRRHGITLFTTLLAGWVVVLSRLSGQRDVVIGSPVTNRMQAEVEPLIGFFVNTLALRVDVSGSPSVSELLRRVSAQVVGGQQHQHLPFEQVVDLLQPPRSLAHTPVFQVMLNWQDRDDSVIDLQDLQVTSLPPAQVMSKFDVTLDLSEVGSCISGSFEYATALFDRATIERHGGYLRRVLQTMVADAAQPVDRLELLGEDELARLDDCNATRRSELIATSWPQLFAEQAQRTPDRVAVQCASRQLTYRALHEESTRLAVALRARGAGAGRIVALLGQRDVDLLVMMVAVLKSGAAYLPLDPSHPSQRWLDVLQEAQPLMLWVGEGLATEQRWLRRKWTGGEVGGTADLQADASPGQALPWPSMDDLAYVLFTSGSTGRPKGVLIEHRGMVNNMRSKFEPLGLGPDDVIAQTASQCFDISVWQFLTALLLGARVLIVKNELTRDPQGLLDHLAAEGASVWEPVPSLMQAALPCARPLPGMRWVMPTGEALSRELVTRWFEQYPGIPLMNAYGPAECSDDVAFQPIHAAVDRVLIGKPVANAQLHVLDENLMRVPFGTVGELAVGGPVVGRGYLGRPEETQAVFKANPHATDAADQRLYLTGDLVRRWPDGSLEYIGRKDFQVKIRGFRIELGEIESCLAQHPAVRDVVVDARELGQGDRQLVAYVTLNTPTATEALQAQLRAHLPDYMQPAAIVVLDALPLNENGKVDRRSLPDPTAEALTRAAYEAPRNDTERIIAGLWQELLQTPQVGRGDSYFDLGGSSLLLIRMLDQLKGHGLVLGVTDVYQLRTVSACAAAIDERRDLAAAQSSDASRPHAPAPAGAVLSEADLLDSLRAQLRQQLAQLARAPVECTLAFSPIQRHLLSWQQRDDIDAVPLSGRHSAAELQDAFAAVAAEQDMLRAALDGDRPQWRLLMRDAVRAAGVSAVDLTRQDPARVDGLLQRIGELLLREKAHAPLAYVAAVVSLTDSNHVLLLALDHLVWDGLSAETLQKRMQQHLRGAAAVPLRNYRHYAEAAARAPAASATALLHEAVDLPALVATMQATRQVLARRANDPLQLVRMDIPLATDGAAAEQAFDCFKRCVMQLTGLARVGMVLNHHGRESGADRWFDQVGLFLDKVPFAIDADTALEQLTAHIKFLQAKGINHVGMAQANADWGSALPDIEQEVLFNFQTIATEQRSLSNGERMMEKLDGTRGILFEAEADVGAGQLTMHCAFRGQAGDVQALQRVALGGSGGTLSALPAAEVELALEVREVHKRYGDFEAVRGVSFSVRKGCCFGILGPNGAGKTSLLGMIEGITPITSGTIRLLGMDVGTEIQHIQPHVGVQLQQNNYFQFLTVAQLLKFYQELRSAVGGKRNGRSIASLLERLDLKDKLSSKVDELSGGQKQRLSIAIALLEDPDVIFLDEPSSALDPHGRISTWEFIEELKRDGSKTIILTTHYMEEAERLCDDILLMDRGKVIAQGQPSQLVQNLGALHAVQFYFGRSQFRMELLDGVVDSAQAEWDARTACLQLRTSRVAETVRDVLALSQRERIDVVNFVVHRPTLEDVFLSLTNQEKSP